MDKPGSNIFNYSYLEYNKILCLFKNEEGFYCKSWGVIYFDSGKCFATPWKAIKVALEDSAARIDNLVSEFILASGALNGRA